jgi:hypothetical protein
MVTFGRLLAVVLVATMLSACGSVDAPSNQASETFSGTLSPGGQVSHNFSVSKTGEMQLVLQSLTPRPVVGFIALAIGVPSGATCSPLSGYVVSQAALSQTYSFAQITKGSYCVLVIDANLALLSDASYTVHLSHP